MAVSQTLSVTEVSGSVNASANTSRVRILWKSTQTGESWNGYTRVAKYYVSINGGAEKEYTVSYTLPQNTTNTIVDTTITVAHKADGSGNVIVRTWMDTDISVGIVEKYATVTLTRIPRASSFTLSSGYKTDAGNPYVIVNDTNSIKVSITRASSSFNHEVAFYFGGTLIDYDDVETSMTYTPKMEKWLKHIKSQRDSFDLSNTKAPSVVVTTYAGDGTRVGEPVEKRFDIYTPNISDTQPSVSMALTPVSSLGSQFSSLYIQGKSKVKASFSGSSAKYGAEISSYRMKVNGVWKSGETCESNILATTGSVSVTGQLTDSRGITGSLTKEITVHSYSKPTLIPYSGENSIICERCTSTGKKDTSGVFLHIKAGRKYSKITSGGEQKNFCILRYRHKVESDKDFSDWKTLIAKSNTASDMVDVVLDNVVPSYLVSYTVQIGVTDDIGESDVIQVTVPTDKVTLHFGEGGRRIGLGRYVDAAEDEGVYSDLIIHGGGVDNLTLGTMLVATSAAPIDLNDYRTVGNYYSPSADSSKYIAHSPYTDGGFSLVIREIQSVNMVRQELFYGRTNWQRHWSGATQEWSDWLRYLMTTEDASTAADFVTEIGVVDIDPNDIDKGYWRYRKWKSGAVDMNGLFKVTPTTEGTLGTAGVYYSQVIYIDLPFSVANFQFTGSSASYHIFIGNTNSVDGNDNQIRLRLYRFTDFSSLSDYNVYIRIIASGKLK